ncbi:Uncharacterized protein TPAR_01837 [Tolypocladium paradoxum]|uniref:TM7S3/TM198-like domain-containing protein n=1 Tax=Tolypocladium paradoxum TaxID=94208 RepID=A0A2S4L696_9HYPO|nr:Uncharacterized protein TPAR_01837 [Tolypocladium paradoxum]
MFPRAARLSALLCLALALQLAAAQGLRVVARQDDGATPTPAPTSTSRLTASNTNANANANTNTGNGKPVETTVAKTDTPESSAPVTGGPTGTAISTTLPSASTTKGPMDFNTTIAADQLPIPPQLTGGWGVAGVIMLATGSVYAAVGIKNRWVHTFFSTAYITALGVTVLILYVMNIPVPNALQGVYVVTVVLSGCAVGAASMFFKEMTEGLGCALGGFCVSMWVLCLVPGGLLRPMVSKAIFVSCLMATAFGLCFSRWTRDWALLLMISFAGSTVTVLGIDCFSRAGLKEFWAYVWDVNGNLFPLGTDTYPVTKGIRIETAAIIVFCLAGIVSQIKLWRMVKEKRVNRAAERVEGQRNLEQEEENVGRQIEKSNARERRHWERVYGDGTSADESRVSDLGDTGSEKRLRRSSVEVIELADMSESEHSRPRPAALMAARDAQEGKVTVRVGADDMPQTPTDVADDMDEKAAGVGAEAATPTRGKRLSQWTTTSRRASQAQTFTGAPEVVPLPFTVPPNEDAKSLSNRSSIATFADDVETAAPARPRHSLAKRLSQGSASLLRSFSQRSGRGGDDPSPENGESSEELVVPRSYRHDADNGSLAATVDGESVSGADGRSVQSDDTHRNMEINAELAEAEEPEAGDGKGKGKEPRPLSMAAASSDHASRDEAQAVAADGAHSPAEQSRVASPVEALPEPSEKAKSMASVSSTPVSLTKDRLPLSLSRVAMSYRTNEWAKHLSYADTPDPDHVRVDEAARPVMAVAKERERSVPVDVEDLKRTAGDGAPGPAMRRPESQASNGSYVPGSARRVSKPSSIAMPAHAPQDKEQGPSPGSPPPTALPQVPAPVAAAGPVRSASAAAMRRASSGFDAIVEEHHAAPASVSPSLTGSEASPRATIPGVVSYASPQTLIGQREMFLRSKSQGSVLPGTPEPPLAAHGPGSDAGSLYSYPAYAAVLSVPDPDDLPLSQRKEIMRRGSLMSLSHSNASFARLPGAAAGHESSENLPFNSHQPKRGITLPAQAVRDAQLATFRQSVQLDLRAGTPLVNASGRETPFTPSSLLGNREAEVQRNIEMQRNVLMGQKEAEAQRREMQRREKAFVDRAFDERMRSGDLLEVHRDAMRKMQSAARRT